MGDEEGWGENSMGMYSRYTKPTHRKHASVGTGIVHCCVLNI